MKSEKNILVAFILNFAFSIFEFFGGIFTGSIAIVSDAIHDIGDAASIGVSYFLEKKSKKQPDSSHTYGYLRYSVLGGLLTTAILLVGSAAVIYSAVSRILSPMPINYNGMILFAVVGLCVNLIAAFVTREGDSLNQKAINLHMLEDVLGWLVVLVGAVVMRFTDISLIDPIMSIGVALFIFISALKNLREVLDLFLEKTPHGIDIGEIKSHLLEIDGVLDVHHIHLWSMDGQINFATMHVKHSGDAQVIKHNIRHELNEHGIGHCTLELETETEHCHEKECHIEYHHHAGHHHHHHH